MNLPTQATYFPVQASPYRMGAGLVRLGTSFGNAERDRQHFQADDRLAVYVRQKASILECHPERCGYLQNHAVGAQLKRVEDWFYRTLELEKHPAVKLSKADGESSFDRLDHLTRKVAEDWVVLEAGEQPQVLAYHVCFPSGWRPERILGQNFMQVHAPVPNFEAVAKASDKLLQAISQRGPYVRFVWTVCPTGSLDRYPAGQTSSLDDSWVLRVERQVTIPFVRNAMLPAACLFLIRVYHYELSSLDEHKQRILAKALNQMPDSIRAYKGLVGVQPEQIGLPSLRD